MVSQAGPQEGTPERCRKTVYYIHNTKERESDHTALGGYAGSRGSAQEAASTKQVGRTGSGERANLWASAFIKDQDREHSKR